MVGCEVEGPLWVVSGRSRGLCGWSWVALGASVGGLGPILGHLWAILGRSWGLCGRAWAALGPLLAVLGRSWGLCGRSWVAFRAFVGDLGPLLGPLLAVLGPLGPKSRSKPGRESDLASGSRPKSGPNPSGKAVLGWDPKMHPDWGPSPRPDFFYGYAR